MSRATSNESQIGPGSYYYFNSNTLPRAQAKKYDFPWDSLPKDWTTSVKLREISKRRKEDRQSSSGRIYFIGLFLYFTSDKMYEYLFYLYFKTHLLQIFGCKSFRFLSQLRWIHFSYKNLKIQNNDLSSY